MIKSILCNIAHRPYELPPGNWRYYQEWNDAVFLHWEIPYDILRPLVPAALGIDRYEGRCYVSLVAFTMQQIRPRFLPALRFLSDFHEINIRTYVENDGKKGVYFLNIEGEKWLSCTVAKQMSGLRYQHSLIRRGAKHYHCHNSRNGFRLDINYEIQEPIVHKTALDTWLTERYCLYLDQGRNLFRYDVHHEEWGLRKLSVETLDLQYRQGGLQLDGQPPLFCHFSPGVKVVAWGKAVLST